jgi:uncharacterized protein YbjT (DUF2867 family)
MRVMILGGSGLVGAALAARLAARGDDVVRVARSGVGTVNIDLANTEEPVDWVPHLAGNEAIVNCAGVLQDSVTDSVRVHDRGLRSVVEACQQVGIRRFIHLSALGVDRETPTEFSRSKLAGDHILMQSGLDWVILRPSVIIGRGAYGASALMRGLAALSMRPVVRDTGPLQLVHREDVLDTIQFFLQPSAPAQKILELAGPRRWSFDEVVDFFRSWMRWTPAATLPLPSWLAYIVYRVGDLAGLLGWRPPIRCTAQREITRGAIGDPALWRDVTGLIPRDVAGQVSAEPASVQERWFARLYLLKPIIFGVFGLFWLATGIISLTVGWHYGLGLLHEGGLADPVSALVVIAGALADLAIGMAIFYRPTSRYGLYAALAISLAYAIIGTILVPRLWSDPLGPMLKIWPVIVLNLVALAVLEDR